MTGCTLNTGSTAGHGLAGAAAGVRRGHHAGRRSPNEIAAARTFVTAAEVPALRAAGYGARVDERDLLVFGDDGRPVGNAARFPDEPARHKLLDVVGDLALLGCDLNATVTSDRGGHALNRDLCRVLLAAVETGDAEWRPAGPALPAVRLAA